MLLFNFAFVLLFGCAGLSLAASELSSDRHARRDAEENVVTENSQESTMYNGIEVPAMSMLNGETLTDDIKHGYWCVILFYCTLHQANS